MKNLITKHIQNCFKAVPSTLTLIFALAVLPACDFESNKAPTGNNPGPTQTKGPGDAGGGDATSSDVSTIESYINDWVRSRLKTSFHRVNYYANQPRKDNSVYESHPPQQVLDMLEGGDIQALIDNVNIVAKRGDCHGPHHEAKDGSAYDNTICLSSTRLSRIPQESLRKEILALAAHELAHLKGANEPDAEAVQYWFLHSTMIAFDASELFMYMHSEILPYKDDIITILSIASSLVSDHGGLKKPLDTEYLCSRILLFDNRDSFETQTRLFPDRLLESDDYGFMVTRMSNLHDWYCREDKISSEEQMVNLLEDLHRAYWIIQDAKEFLLRLEDQKPTWSEWLFPSDKDTYYLHEVPKLVGLLNNSHRA